MPNGRGELGELLDGAGVAVALLAGDGAGAPPGQIGTGFISAMVPS
jgi:hypothetical protein